MESDTKRSSLVAGILGARQKENAEVVEPREAVKDTRQAIPTPMLDVILQGGEIESFSYAYLTRVQFVPGDTITLHFGDIRVVIDGYNLQETREKIRLHKADSLQEGTEAEGDLKREEAAHIERIEIESEEKERKRYDAGSRKSVSR